MNSSPIILLFATVVLLPLVTSTFDYSICNNKNAGTCFSLPTNCWETIKPECKVLFYSQYDPNKVQINLELVSTTITSDHYIAVGISTSNLMSGLVSACFASSIDSNTKLIYSFNSYNAHSNNPITDQSLVKGFVSDPKYNSFQDGELRCKWQIDTPLEVSYTENTFNFTTERYYIQLATGSINPSTGKLGYHGDQKVASSQPINLTTHADIQISGTPKAIRWHASLMIFGWLGCVTISIVMARFTRDLWPDGKLFGLKYWFVVHRCLMIFGWLTIVASYIVIFIHFKGWNHGSKHGIIGIIAGSLATIQILNSFLRPAPDSKYRWIFDYGHWFVGTSAHMLAACNIMYYTRNASDSSFWLLISYLVVYIMFSDLLRKLEGHIKKFSSSRWWKQTLQLLVFATIAAVIALVVAMIVERTK